MIILLILLFLGVYFLGVPLLTGYLMRSSWKARKKADFLQKKVPYYKDPVWLIINLIISFIVLSLLFYLVITIFDASFHNLASYT